jgi:hypothetical protein
VTFTNISHYTGVSILLSYSWVKSCYTSDKELMLTPASNAMPKFGALNKIYQSDCEKVINK